MENQLDFVSVPIPCDVIDAESSKVFSGQNEDSIVPEKISHKLRQLRYETGASVDLSALPVNTTSGVFKVAFAHGSKDQILRCKAGMLKNCCERMERSRVPANAYFILDDERKVKARVKDHVASIISETGTDIAISVGKTAMASMPFIHIDAVGDVFLEITGPVQSVRAARQRCLAMVDEMSGLFIETIKISREMSNLITIVAGRNHSNYIAISNQFDVNIYLPPPSASLLQIEHAQMEQVIYVTGKKQSAEMARKEILGLLERKRRPVMLKIGVSRKKIEFLKAFHTNNLISLMEKTSIVLEFPDENAFSDKYSILISAENEPLAKLAVKRIMDLLMTVTKLKIKIPPTFENQFKNAVTKTGQRAKVVTTISSCDATIVGFNEDILNFAKNLAKEILLEEADIVFSLDLASEYLDFITGKKNGKIHKITRSCGCVLDLRNPFPERISAKISSNSLKIAVEGFSQFLDELPSEFEFFVADTHHKRIIGVGGKNIQGVMKEFGVYVKFLNADEFKSIGGLNEYDENVIARTPSKNATNLKRLYLAVMSMVDHEFHLKRISSVEVHRRYHFVLKKLKGEIEQSTDSRLIFPPLGTGIDMIRIFGTKEGVTKVLNYIGNALHESFILPVRISVNSGLSSVCNSLDFMNFKKSVQEKLSLQINFQIFPDRVDLAVSGTQATMKKAGNEAGGLLLDFLKTKGVSIPSNVFVQTPRVEELGAFQAISKDEPLSDDNSIDVLFFQSHSDIGLPMKQKVAHLTGSAPNLRSANPVAGLASEFQNHAGEEGLFSIPLKPQRAGNPLPIGSTSSHKMRLNSANASKILHDKNTDVNLGSLHSAVDQITSYSNGQSLIKNMDDEGTGSEALSIHARRNTLEGTKIPPKILTKALFSGGEAYNGISSAPLRERILSPLMPNSFKTDDKISTIAPDDEKIMRDAIIQNIMALDIRENNRLGMLLEQLDLAKYKEVFIENDVDFEMFLTLTEQDLKELGVSLGARRKMNLAIAEIKRRRLGMNFKDQQRSLQIRTVPPVGDSASGHLLSAPARQAPWSVGGNEIGIAADRLSAAPAAYFPAQDARLNPFGPLSAFAEPSSHSFQQIISPVAQKYFGRTAHSSGADNRRQ